MVIVRHKNLNAIVLKEVFQAGLNQMKKHFWPVVEIKSFFETRGTHSFRVYLTFPGLIPMSGLTASRPYNQIHPTLQ